MKCNQCGSEVFENGTCKRCGGLSSPIGEIFGAAAVLGVLWIGSKVLKAGLSRANGASPNAPAGLPREFQENRSRPSTEIPGEPRASAMADLQREMERRQHAAELGRMMMDHIRSINKIRLGQR